MPITTRAKRAFDTLDELAGPEDKQRGERLRWSLKQAEMVVNAKARQGDEHKP